MKEAKIKNVLKLNAELAKTINNNVINIQELKVKRNQELSMKTERLKESIDTLNTKLAL